MSDEDQLARLTYLAGPALLGSVEDDQEVEVKVYREADGSVVLWAPDIGWHERFTPAERDKLREMLDRAAMPGPELARFPVYGCCEHCEHCGQCQQPGHCPHGFDQPPHPAPCMFDDCAPGHTVAGEAIVTGASRG